METKFKITIPKPCHEDWDKMSPESTGKFCTSCTKSVVDFTQMSTTEIQNYFIEYKNERVCGRFRNEQLDSIIIQIPRDVLFAPMHFHKMFMLALLITMGTSLLSCQNNDGVSQKIDEVKVVDSVERRATVGILLPEKIMHPKPTIIQDSITGAYYESYPKQSSNNKCVKTKGEVVINEIEQEKIVTPKKSNENKGIQMTETITTGDVIIETITDSTKIEKE